MENEERLFVWLADTWRSGFSTWARFMGSVYGGEPMAKAEEIASLEQAYQNSPDTAEREP
ncbi:hypothetical protein [Actinophytocola sp.]|uniref:hypothetical protein n=1 Tax=Actinophytocola sp. TaxID=1872138 RepID=UPI00389A70E1